MWEKTMTIDEAMVAARGDDADAYKVAAAAFILAAEVERLRRWEKIIEEEIEAGLRYFGDDRLADRFRESTSPIQQRIMMVFHCLINAAEAGGKG